MWDTFKLKTLPEEQRAEVIKTIVLSLGLAISLLIVGGFASCMSNISQKAATEAN